MKKSTLATNTGLALILMMSASAAFAVPFTSVRIGDEDGFGFNILSNADYTTVIGTHENGGDPFALGVGDQLPSLGGTPTAGGLPRVLTGDSDDFDNRTGETYTISAGSTLNAGMAGVEYTDISLSTSYATSSAAGEVYNANTNSDGSGGAFPDPSGPVTPNQPGFVFDFFVVGSNIDSNNDIFFNMLFGDYDVTPAEVKFTFGDSSTQTLAVATQSNALDGLVQAAFVTLDFDDVFTANGSDYDGYVEVDFVANNEPYTAFDFVELSTTAIQTTVPEPGTLLLLGSGLLGLSLRRRKAVRA